MKLRKNVINSAQDERERRKLEHVPELILAVGMWAEGGWQERN